MVEHQPSKLVVRVRFPSPAPKLGLNVSIKKIIKEDVLKQKPDSIKSNQKQEPDVILEWKDEL